MPKQVAIRGTTMYLFISGIIVLFISPFLPWFYYGINFLLPPNASLIYLFEFGVGRVSSFVPLLTSSLVLYLTGIVAVIIVTVIAKKPVFFGGVLTAVFPLFVIFVHIHSYVPHLLIYGVSTALLGSILLEASYLSYRSRNAKMKVTTGTEVPRAGEQKSIPHAVWVELGRYPYRLEHTKNEKLDYDQINLL